MIVTGYQIMDRLEELKEAAKLADEQFEGALYRFAGDADKPAPAVILQAYQEAQDKIARLQTAQSAYNLAVSVEAQGERMALELAVKRIGAANRIQKINGQRRRRTRRAPTTDLASRACPATKSMSMPSASSAWRSACAWPKSPASGPAR